MREAVLIGYGNVGKELERVLEERHIPIRAVVRSTGVYRDGLKIGAVAEHAGYLDIASVAFVSVPSKGSGDEMLHYYTEALVRGACVVTCEKAVLANHFDALKPFRERLRYSASVGGDSGILPAISRYEGAIEELRAVVNGTLNHIADGLAHGHSEEEMFEEVVDKGFAEPGASSFAEAIEGELSDVAYKAAILANHSGLYERTILPAAVPLEGYRKGFRCAVILRPQGIEAGFILEDDGSFPRGADNALWINGRKAVEGPGAGGRITAERMFKDFSDIDAP